MVLKQGQSGCPSALGWPALWRNGAARLVSGFGNEIRSRSDGGFHGLQAEL